MVGRLTACRGTRRFRELRLRFSSESPREVRVCLTHRIQSVASDAEAAYLRDARYAEDSAVTDAARDVDGGVTATGVLSRERGNLITISSTL